MLVGENQKAAARPARGAVKQRRGLEVGLWLSVPVILLVVYFVQMLEQFSTVGCEGVCDLGLLLAARAAYPWEVAASLVLAAAAAGALRLMGKPTFWAGLIAVVLVLASASITSLLFQSGLAPMYERNDRIARGELPTAPPPPSPVGEWGTNAEEAPYLEFRPDGTFVGTDGCNELRGEWIQGVEGEIALTTLSETTESCEGVDTWLSNARTATIVEKFLYINGPAGSPIGGLVPRTSPVSR